MEQEKFPNAPVYNPEKVEKFHSTLHKLTMKIMHSDDKKLSKTNQFQRELVEKVKNLASKYPNAIRYGMFHILGGSTIPEDLPALYDDFPGNDSIESFLKDLETKYGQ